MKKKKSGIDLIAELFGEEELQEIEDIVRREVTDGKKKLSPVAFALYGLLIEAFTQHEDEESLGVQTLLLAQNLQLTEQVPAKILGIMRSALQEINTSTALKYDLEIQKDDDAHDPVLIFRKTGDQSLDDYRRKLMDRSLLREQPCKDIFQVMGKPCDSIPLDEQRREPRRDTEICVECRSKDLAEPGLARNICIQGVFVETQEKFDVGQEIVLTLPLADSNDEVQLNSKVVRVTSEGVGMKFVSVKEKEEK